MAKRALEHIVAHADHGRDDAFEHDHPQYLPRFIERHKHTLKGDLVYIALKKAASTPVTDLTDTNTMTEGGPDTLTLPRDLFVDGKERRVELLAAILPDDVHAEARHWTVYLKVREGWALLDSATRRRKVEKLTDLSKAYQEVCRRATGLVYRTMDEPRGTQSQEQAYQVLEDAGVLGELIERVRGRS